MTFRVVDVFTPHGQSPHPEEDVVAKEGGVCLRAVCRSEDEIVAAAEDADVIIGAFSGPTLTLSAKTIEQLPKLKLVAVLGSGYDGIDLKAATDKAICVSNCPDYGLEELANHTMLFILALAKKLLPTIDAVRAGKWDAVGAQQTIRTQILTPLFRLSLQTLGLIGFGGISRAVVPKARAFGLRIITYSPRVPEAIIRGAGVEPVDLDTLLQESDFVSVHAALHEQNRKMMGLEQFRKMKRTAFFTNVARGGLVDEEALYTALTEGLIAGAALDAMDPEPPNPGNRLLSLPNVIITPHTGQYSQESQAAIARMPYEEAARVLRGEWPRDIAFLNPQVKDRFAAKWGKK